MTPSRKGDRVMADKVGAIFTGGDFQALGAARTLARKGIPVILLDSDACIGRYSRYVSRFFRSPRVSQVEAYAQFLCDLAGKEKLQGWVVFPNSDEGVYLLSKNKALLERHYRIPTPSWDIIQNVYIKKNTYQIAEKHGIAVPKTYYPASMEELLHLELRYPVIIKPSIRDHYYTKTKKKALYVPSEKDLKLLYTDICRVIDPSEVMIQEFIPGGPKHLYSCCPFFKEGRIAASITARRARQHPMDFGHASTFAETVDIPEIRDAAEKFLRAIDYYGIGEVEFMMDTRDGRYKLIEVNPRIWGWHTLAIAAGVDLPYYLYQDAVGEEVSLPKSVKHLKWVRMTTDLPTVFQEIMKGRVKLGEYLASMRGEKVFAVFSKDDPVPFFVELMMIPYLWMKRGS